jgi:hypothetical protein
MENPDNGTTASVGCVGVSEGDVEVEGDDGGVMGAPVTRPKLIDGEDDGTPEGTVVVG